MEGNHLSNSNLKTFDNFYADLAQSSYRGRPVVFPYEKLRKDEQKALDSGSSIPFDFSKENKFYNSDKKQWETTSGGKNLPHNGKVYLQPDPDLHSEGETMDLQVPNPNGGYHKETYVVDHYQKGLLTDEKAGFNAYFLTDTPSLGKDTQKAYMTIRGRDGMSLANLNDWVDNDGQFAINSIHIN